MQYISEGMLFNKGHKLLLAVSGGVDSVVLCELCSLSGFKFGIAHVNFQLRGKESEDDALFVKQLASIYGVPYFETMFDTAQIAEKENLSIQVAARQLRYDWFEELRKKEMFDVIVTAHHADDNIETMLMNFFKGTGIAGMRGIVPKNGHIVRPLLFAFKEDIFQFAQEHQLAYREDSSNASSKYTRNYFRNELIPAIEKVFPAVRRNLAANIERFSDIEVLSHLQLQKIKEDLITAKGAEIHIPVLKLLRTAAYKTVIYDVIKEFGFTASQVEDVSQLLAAGSGKYIRSASHVILKDRKWLIISPSNSEGEVQTIIIEETDQEIFFPGGTLRFESIAMPVAINTDKMICQLDKRQIQFPLLLRQWKQGDYFYPLGMQKKKKLSRFFIDLKIPLTQKEKIWVLESNKKIIWIPGLRIDDRFKITKSTTELLQINWVPAQ